MNLSRLQFLVITIVSLAPFASRSVFASGSCDIPGAASHELNRLHDGSGSEANSFQTLSNEARQKGLSTEEMLQMQQVLKDPRINGWHFFDVKNPNRGFMIVRDGKGNLLGMDLLINGKKTSETDFGRRLLNMPAPGAPGGMPAAPAINRLAGLPLDSEFASQLSKFLATPTPQGWTQVGSCWVRVVRNPATQGIADVYVSRTGTLDSQVKITALSKELLAQRPQAPAPASEEPLKQAVPTQIHATQTAPAHPVATDLRSKGMAQDEVDQLRTWLKLPGEKNLNIARYFDGYAGGWSRRVQIVRDRSGKVTSARLFVHNKEIDILDDVKKLISE